MSDTEPGEYKAVSSFFWMKFI